MKMIEEFSTPGYFEALGTSIGYGLGVVCAMLALGAVMVLFGGGLSARWWNKEPAASHHH